MSLNDLFASLGLGAFKRLAAALLLPPSPLLLAGCGWMLRQQWRRPGPAHGLDGLELTAATSSSRDATGP